MPTIKQLNQILEDSLSLKYIAQAYTEISAAKLKKIRMGIEKNRLFFEEITKVLHVVKETALRQRLSMTHKPKGTVSILQTSNYRFCGDLDHKLIHFFIVQTTKLQTDRIIIGKTAEEYFNGYGFSHPFKSLVFKTDTPDEMEMNNLANLASEYNQVLVFYPKMKTVMVQQPSVVDIAQYSLPHKEDEKTYLEYIFEPEITDILKLFENQITSLLLKQTFLEAELARTASRMVSMDEAQINADTYIKKQKRLLAQAKTSQLNMQLLETVASLLKWKEVNNNS